MAEETADAPTDDDPVEMTDEQADELADMALSIYEGETNLEELLGVDADTVATIQQQAYQLYSNDRLEKAEPLARGLVAMNKSRFYPNMLLGDILFQQGPGVSEQAEEIVEDAEEGNSRAMTRYEEARKAFEQALELEPDDDFVKTRLAELYLKLDEDDKADELLNDLADNSDNEETRNWANALLGIGREQSD